MSASVTERCGCGASINYRGDSPNAATSNFRANHRHDDPDPVTLDSPTVAVPTSALDELRASFRRIAPGVVLTLQEKSIRTFLAAVDEAAR